MHCYAVGDGRAAGCLLRARFSNGRRRALDATRVTRFASLFAPLSEESSSSLHIDCDRSRLLVLFLMFVLQNRLSSPQLTPFWQKAYAGSFRHSGALLDVSRCFSPPGRFLIYDKLSCVSTGRTVLAQLETAICGTA